ncbi:MAG: flavodoxin [Ruminococcus sp.]
MKLKRNILIPVLAVILTFVLAACSAGSSESTESTPSAPSESEPEQTDGNVLVAYFSYTGNTEEVAGQIADLTGGTLAEIQRAEEYGDLEEEAEAEITEGVHPEITVSADNVEDYDTIFVGYPIWWDEAPAMIATFLDSYDFSGKTIVPFCTSASDSIDNSLHIFSELCPDAEIAEGLTANDKEDIEPWLQGLGLVQ